MKIFAFGSEIVEKDSLAFKVADAILSELDKSKESKSLGVLESKSLGVRESGIEGDEGQEPRISSSEIEIIKCTDPEEMLELPKNEIEGQDVAVLDVAKGIREVQPLMIDDLQPKGIFTIHDFNLGLYLKLLQTTNELRGIKIVGIPYDSKEAPEKLAKKVREILGI